MGFTQDPNQVNQILLKKRKMVVGGVDVLLMGKPGCGKTTALVQTAILTKEQNNEVIVFRSSSDCQWTFFNNVKNPPKMILWLKKGLNYTLFDRKKERRVDASEYFYKIRRWQKPKELVRNLSKKHVNVIQTAPFSPINARKHIKFCREWMEIYAALNSRYWEQPVSVFFDEVEDLAPEGGSKDFFNVELSLSSTIRSSRKNDVSSYFASHSRQEIHWRVTKKIRWFIYMKGSKQPKDSRLTVNLNKIKVGEAWIEGDQIEKFNFKNLGREHKLRALIT